MAFVQSYFLAKKSFKILPTNVRLKHHQKCK